ncbi:MAG: glutamate-cysteine ligase family protein [Candidatus Korarchaeota archaeon]|nr:glutamate-cysteine ligase family protein [Thermoproteota archaeon]MCR8463017.1 glutamate-cysteine ligase family protein [Thermoproteota archaeon]MCR8470647.1 glutamate-cysteine ligase family protein [Thermoproteota archaeon]MCR8471615.1 glutamate-cysteine ligase family protein [Thermoproteota archaeon]MCR8473031.1 glutamate-cysteine ligase family protein [Thermoproteota archaeon]
MEESARDFRIRVGIENELMTVNDKGFIIPAATLIVNKIIDDIVSKKVDASVLNKYLYGIQWEPHPAQLEIVTQPFNYPNVEKNMRFIYDYLDNAAGEKNVKIYLGSMHPIQSSPFPINGTHVSISIVPKRRKVMPRKFLAYVHNNIRRYLPELIALTANSPVMASKYSGFASSRLYYSRVLKPSRYAIIKRSKTTVIPREKRALLKYAFIFTRDKRYENKVIVNQIGMRLLELTPRGPHTNIVEDHDSSPESSRVEVRFIDNPSTLEYLTDITNILIGVSLEAIDMLRKNEKIPNRAFLSENRLRAIRDGIQAEFLGEDGEPIPARESVLGMINRIKLYLDSLGIKLKTSLGDGIPEIEKFGKPVIVSECETIQEYLNQGKVFLRIQLSSNRTLIDFSGNREAIGARVIYGLVFPEYKLEWTTYSRNIISRFTRIYTSYWILTKRGYVKIHPDDKVISAKTPIGVLTQVFGSIYNLAKESQQKITEYIGD